MVPCETSGFCSSVETVVSVKRAPIDTFDTSACHSHRAAMIREFDPARFIPPLKMRRIDAVGRLAVSATHMLFDAAGCRPGPEGRDDLGVALGTFTAGLDSLVEYLD